MARFEVIMPKLGESIIEATITKWLKSVGDTIEEEDPIVEIATDKVDSEIPSPVDGKLEKLLFEEGATVAVGEVIAYITTEGGDDAPVSPETNDSKENTAVGKEAEPATQESIPAAEKATQSEAQPSAAADFSQSDRFYSPLVKNIAREEGIAPATLDSIPGTGKDGRLTKNDLLKYLKEGKAVSQPAQAPAATPSAAPSAAPKVSASAGDEIIQMDRMRKLIADHMVQSVHTSPHVTSFVEVDMTPIVHWRNKHKKGFEQREGIRLTFTHLFLEAIAKTIKEYPMVNASVDGGNIILRKRTNIGMAVALPSGNLIVPVIKDVDEKSLLGIAKASNDLAERARDNKLQPDEITGGTITLTNLGSFGTVMGTPIINQPQVAIVAVGAITKRPVVIEGPEGDSIGIRHMMYLSLSYDHRIVDGALGGKFIYRMKELLEGFDASRTI
jgi:2-oxoglutarate dehydrogenase E2 component (dihydrolipoamide succinyltransferase)